MYKFKLKQINFSDFNQLPKNKETIVIDAACIHLNIKYSQDTELLNEARVDLTKTIEMLYYSSKGKNAYLS